ncbi:MAG: hypothetical protein AUI14_08005 [Actinobacteria bacterium 13_2_20CM_2_71_6]|nr:MAG: hypothetical protein AUI14_08005 [Actinobacteria bacterium 13_2_20CM_2_71_6]
MDTVEWGSAEPTRRRLPSLTRSVPLAGALALTAAGFALLVAAELMAWATVQPSSPAARAAGSTASTTLKVGLDRLVTMEALSYHIGEIALLGAVGFALASSTGRRRAAMGTALGVAAGQIVMIVSVARASQHIFDTLAGLGIGDQSDSGLDIAIGPGVYLSAAGVLLLAAATVTAGALQRGWWQGREPAPRPASAVGTGPMVSGPGEPGGERELTVTPMEPIDDSYFARPDSR